jgi:hypothetical protein
MWYYAGRISKELWQSFDEETKQVIIETVKKEFHYSLTRSGAPEIMIMGDNGYYYFAIKF